MIGLASGAKEARVDANAFGAGLLFPVVFVMVGALASKWSFKKLGFIAILLVLMGGMYASASRGALLAMAVMFVYLLFRSRYKAQLIVISTLAVLVSFFMPNSPWERFSTALSGGGSGRLAIWRVGWEALKHHWLIGAGVGMYPNAYDEVLIRVYQSSFQQWDRVAHNTILSTAVELGIVGLILLVLAWRAQWAGLRDLRRSGAISSDLMLVLEASLIGVTIASFFLSILTLKLVYLLLIVIALTRSLALSQARAAASVTPARRAPTQFPLPLTARAPN
jgi:O-antigen ligase